MCYSSNNKQELLACIERTSKNLRTLLNDSSIKLILIKSQESYPIKDYKTQWNEAAHFPWDTLEVFSTTYKPFSLALYSRDKLSGFCEISISSQHNNKKSTDINVIEGAPESPLKGYVIPAFSQTILDLAKNFKFSFIRVIKPEKLTIPSYLRIGFEQKTNKWIYKPVTSDAELNWNAVFKYRRQKGLPVPEGL